MTRYNALLRRGELRITSQIVVLLVAVAFAGSASSDTPAQIEEALTIINNFADRLCEKVPLETRTENIDLNGTAKAELGSVVKKLGNLGITGAAKYSTTESQNVLQKDLANVLNQTRECKLKVWNDLKYKFEIAQPVQAPQPSSQVAPAAAPANYAAPTPRPSPQPRTVRLPAECSSTSDPALKRRPDVFLGYWLAAIQRMRTERNNYDMQNLVEIWGRIPVGLDGEQLLKEAGFTLHCLELADQLEVAPGTKLGQWWGVQFKNDSIKFK